MAARDASGSCLARTRRLSSLHADRSGYLGKAAYATGGGANRTLATGRMAGARLG